ncbi:MAG: OmpH family outer membrane protein [Saprospirales bacterium]|jgi:outer membrane protein|nr:OmpH family outer membrane protein [Saprospirales bacterium]MBK8923164.1 OmpH family outer membrane protein [Saprospirales bacterium]
MKKICVLTLGLILTLSVSGFAQKFGYLNSVALLTELPEVKQADSDLQAYQTQLTKRGQEMVKDLQDEVTELERKKEQGIISPKDYAAQAEVLKGKENAIGTYEQDMYKKLSEKREELYKPILERVNTAMQAIARENGYLLVFDTSTQVLLYADETLDITPLVKARLGIAGK